MPRWRDIHFFLDQLSQFISEWEEIGWIPAFDIEYTYDQGKTATGLLAIVGPVQGGGDIESS